MLIVAVALATGQIWQAGYPLREGMCVGRPKARHTLALPGFGGKTRANALSQFRYDSGKMTVSLPRPSADATAPAMIEVRGLAPEAPDIFGGTIDDPNGRAIKVRYDWTRNELTLSDASWSFRGKCS